MPGDTYGDPKNDLPNFDAEHSGWKPSEADVAAYQATAAAVRDDFADEGTKIDSAHVAIQVSSRLIDLGDHLLTLVDQAIKALPVGSPAVAGLTGVAGKIAGVSSAFAQAKTLLNEVSPILQLAGIKIPGLV